MPENPNCIVTVITTTFNLIKNDRVDFFKQCVESVHSQDYQYIEHLVIDGASSDGSLEIIREYEQKGWLTCISEPDKGIYDAMNKGIRLAKGKYIAFLNSDDFWHDSHGVSESVKALEATQAAFSYADRRIVNQDGSLLFEERANIGCCAHQMPFCHQTVFAKRKTLLRYGGFNIHEYKSAADYDLMLRLILGRESAVYVPNNFTSFRLGGFSDEGYAISLEEIGQIRMSLLPEVSSEMLHFGYINESLMNKLLCNTHPSVALNIMKSYTLKHKEFWQCNEGIVRIKSDGTRETHFPLQGDPYEGGDYTKHTEANITSERKFMLCGFFPFLKCRTKNNCEYWKLFGIIPAMKTVRKPGKTKWYLFFFVPILSVKKGN